jgi:hypothetical protein
VVEIYGLTSETKTTHLEDFLEKHWGACGGAAGKLTPVIRWVDENHALFVCPDVASASALMEVNQHQLLLRPHSMGSVKSLEHPSLGELFTTRVICLRIG